MTSRDTPGDGSDEPGTSSGQTRREAMRAAARRPSLAMRSVPPPANQEPLLDPTPAPSACCEVFVSYSRTDTGIVRTLVTRLRNAGVSVTWDQDFIGGTDFADAICTAIDASRAVIVVWSEASVRSPFVRDEAKRAAKRSRLVTTHVPGFDADDAPLGFGHLNAVAMDDFSLVRRSLAQHGVTFRP